MEQYGWPKLEGSGESKQTLEPILLLGLHTGKRTEEYEESPKILEWNSVKDWEGRKRPQW